MSTEKSLTDIINASPAGETIFGAGVEPTFAVVGNLLTPAPSTVSKSLGSGAFGGRNVARLQAAFMSNASAMDLSSYDPATLYSAVLAGDESHAVWDGKENLHSEHGTVDSTFQLSHLKFSGSPNLITHQPSTTANAFVPDTSVGASTARVQEQFEVTAPDTMATDQLKNKKSYPQQQGGTALSTSQNPSDTKDSLGSWLNPGYGTWAG